MSYLDQREMLMQQIEFFIEMTALEQSSRLSDQLPSLKSYTERRVGTGAVLICLAIHE